MKTYRHLYPQICDWYNVADAYRRARKGKRGKPATATFEYDQEENLITLQHELAAQTYQPGPYHIFHLSFRRR